MSCIPENLQKLIDGGFASYNNWVHGVSAVGNLPVPKGTTVVIIGFKWFPFCDIPNADILTWLENSIHEIRFTSAKNSFHYLIREPLQPITLPNGNMLPMPVTQPMDFCTYQVHTTDIAITILGMPSIQAWAPPVFLPVPDNSNQPNTPQGYNVPGAANFPAVRSVDLGVPGGQYLPLGAEHETIAPGVGYVKNLQVNSGIGILNQPLNGEVVGNYTYPIVNISYVSITKAPPETLIKPGT